MGLGYALRTTEPEVQQKPGPEEDGGSSDGVEQQETAESAPKKGIIRLMSEVCVAGTSFEESLAELSAIAAAETEAPEKKDTVVEIGAETETPKRNGTDRNAIPRRNGTQRNGTIVEAARAPTSVRTSPLKPADGGGDGTVKKTTRKGRSLSPWRTSAEKEKPNGGAETQLMSVEEARAAVKKVAAVIGPAALIRARRPALTPLKVSYSNLV